MNTASSADDATSATAFFHGLPVSAWTISPNSFSRSRSSCAARPRMAPRVGTGVRAHAAAAPAADDSACATSAAPPRATCAITVSVAGLRFSNVVPSFGTTSTSAIQCGTYWGYIELALRGDTLREHGLRDAGGVETVIGKDVGI